MQVGRPGKESHCESPIQRLSELRVTMEVVKRSAPVLQGIRSGATTQTLSDPWLQRAAPHPKPLRGLLVEFVPGEFIHDDAPTRAQQAADPVEDNRQVVDMVERKARHRDIETSSLVEIFDPRLAEDRTLRCSWI